MEKEKLEGMSFDSSLFSETEELKITPSEYKEKIISLLEPILRRRFPGEFQKQKIRDYKGRISCACPYCGDSMKVSSKKRGNFILEGKHQNFYKCFNCGVFKRFDNFFKDYNTSLDLNVIDYIVENQGDFVHSNTHKYDSSLIFDLEEIDKFAFDREDFKSKFGLVEVKNSLAERWLRNRMQYKNEHFLYSKRKNYIAILNLTQSGKIIGLQRRTLSNNPYVEKYLTYKNSKLRELMKLDTDVPDYIDAISETFNILRVNYNQPITGFEGPLDSFLYKNSIASTGIHKSLPFELGIRQWFDYDEDGREKSVKYIEDGQSVFLWGKLQRDIGFPYRKKWDLNDLMLWLNQNGIKVPFFDSYFSNDSLDIIDI